MKRCWITNRKLFASTEEMVAKAAAASGLSMVQVREKDLSARSLIEIVRLFLESMPGTPIIVNTRLDVALAARAQGVHLPDGSPPPESLRRICPPGFLIGVSCHSIEGLTAAGSEGADYAFLAPVFEPLSKESTLPPLGLDYLARACRASNIPVYALGGISRANEDQCLAAGAAGVGGISLLSGLGG